HAGCLDTLKNTSGGIQFLGGDKLVSWSSKKHDCTSMSLAEADHNHLVQSSIAFTYQAHRCQISLHKGTVHDNQNGEPSVPHEVNEQQMGHLNDEEPEINEPDQGQPNQAQSEDRPTRTRVQPSSDNWREAMKNEIKALERNGTWTLKDLPKGKRAIDSKRVYKIKFKPNGEVIKYKARLVAKGFTQMEGVDYHDTFAPVAKLVTVRTLLTVAVKRDWIIHQLDVNNAFLHGDLNEEIYMKIPQGFSKEGETRVCRLRKSLYGLKQASQIKKQLDKEFSIKDLGTLKYFLGIEVVKTKDGLVLSQRKYTLDIFNDCGNLGCKPSTFPIEQGLKMDKGEHEATVDASQYRRLIGHLLNLQATRPDITYSVNVLSQFVADPRKSHLEAANRVLQYLKATPGQGILFSRSGDLALKAYCDADWLGCSYTRRLPEAEYRAMASTVSEVLWVRWLLSELLIDTSSPTPLFFDNQASRHIANYPVFHERTKHVEMDCYFVRERVDSKEIVPMHISSKLQIADLLTKERETTQILERENKLNQKMVKESTTLLKPEGHHTLDEDNQPEEGEIITGDVINTSSSTSVEKHPLEHSWTFWFDNPSAKSKAAYRLSLYYAM
nr:putative reverse transcriptase, RNA-dependent DNA polymerase, Gag-polypeptide of LTR copia-type [Tanacetum cinerariifolium]